MYFRFALRSFTVQSVNCSASFVSEDINLKLFVLKRTVK